MSYKAKKKRRSNKVIDIENHQSLVQKKREVNIIPRNKKQEEYYDYLNDESQKIVFAIGPAGTGKTILATLQAISLFKQRTINKIIISRPAVENGEKHGFLPGDLNKKMEPWCMPILDIFHEFYSASDMNVMIEEKVLEICPLAYMRGRNFNDSFIILDEAQNCTPEQMKMALTRIGENSRMIVTGDYHQSDLKGTNGLQDIIPRLQNNPQNGISTVMFTKKYVERSEVVKAVLDLYHEDE